MDQQQNAGAVRLTLRRRDLITLFGMAMASPLATRAQQKAMPVIGFLNAFSPTPSESPSAPFRQALSEAGYVEGRNVAFEFRWAEGQYDRLPAMASDLVHTQVPLIVANGSPAALAAKAATTTIPIVFWTGGDPVADGLVGGLSHPGGNLTGVATFNTALGGKRLELLQVLVPKADVFAVLINPANSNAEPQSRDAQEAARVKGVQMRVLRASTDDELEAAFATLLDPKPDGLIVSGDAFLFTRRDRVIALAAQYAVPAIYTVRDWAVAGGLISYTNNAPMAYEIGNYVGRILNGEKPGDLPVQRSTKFELVINLKTAKALGLAVPQLLLAQAEEVIE